MFVVQLQQEFSFGSSQEENLKKNEILTGVVLESFDRIQVEANITDTNR